MQGLFDGRRDCKPCTNKVTDNVADRFGLRGVRFESQDVHDGIAVPP